MSSQKIHSSKLITSATEGRFSLPSGGELNPQDGISAYLTLKLKCSPQPHGLNTYFLARSGALKAESKPAELLGVEGQSLGPFFVLVPIYSLVYHEVRSLCHKHLSQLVT